jgi:hypothetical protein
LDPTFGQPDIGNETTESFNQGDWLMSVTTICRNGLPGLRLPDLDCFIVAAAGDQPTIGRKIETAGSAAWDGGDHLIAVEIDQGLGPGRVCHSRSE